MGAPPRHLTAAARRPPLLIALVACASAYVAARLVAGLVAGPHVIEALWVSGGAVVFPLAALSCLLRARRDPEHRRAWNAIAAGLVLYVGGTAVGIALGGADSTTWVSYVGWLSFYACLYYGLTELGRRAIRPFPTGAVLDTLLALGAFASVGALVAEIIGLKAYSLWEVAAGFAFPLLDLLLLVYVLWIAAAGRTRHRRPWAPLIAAFAVMAAADTLLIALAAAGHLSVRSFNTIWYPVAAALIGVAAFRPPAPPTALHRRPGRSMASPTASLISALLVLAVGDALGFDGPSVAVALATLAVSVIRGALLFRELASVDEGRRFERGFDEAGIGMAVVTETGAWLRVNASLATLLGTDRAALTTGGLLDHFSPHEHGELRRIVEAIRQGELRIDPVDAIGTRVDGSTFEASVSADLIATGRGESQLFVQIQDVTQQRRAQRLGEAVAGLARAAVVESNMDALLRRMVADLTTALDAPFVAVVVQEEDAVDPGVVVSPGAYSAELAAAIASGIGPVGTALGGRTPVILTAENVAADPALHAFADAGLGPILTAPIAPTIGLPAAICVAWPATRRPSDLEEVRFVEAVSDVVASALDRTRREAQSRYQALHDPLTGLANRALLTAHVAHVLQAAQREQGQVGVMLIDLDRFKNVNDTLGHGVGDDLLREVAHRLTDHTRAGDLVARLGGDEFVIVFAEVEDAEGVEPLAARLVEALAEPIVIDGRDLYVGGSVGIVVEPALDVTPETLLRDADVAMYRAKEAGGGRYEVFDAELRARLVRRSSLEGHLRHAVERGELRLALQPQVALDGRGLTAFEALVRWERPSHGLVSPARFIPVAEESGLIKAVGAWVLGEACAWLGSAGHDRALRLSVNLSARQITDDLPRVVQDALDAGGVTPDRLCLEITESLLITDPQAVAILDAIRMTGVRLALDDFGTGWSSLSALQRHVVDELKLDRSMVVSAGEGGTSLAITRAAVDMARAVGLEIVAEGVETAEQLRLVRSLGCDVAQGFLFAPALWAAEADRYVRERSWMEHLQVLES